MLTPRCSVGMLRRWLLSYIVWPSMVMRPSLGCSSPAMARKVVVLPQPDGPSRVTCSPRPTVKLTPFTATWSP
jgi:hypothetical protein